MMGGPERDITVIPKEPQEGEKGSEPSSESSKYQHTVEDTITQHLQESAEKIVSK